MPPPAFATPLPQSCRSETLEWRFPKPFHNYVLTGKSRAAWHTSFVIPQLNLLLDAGLCVNKLRPKHIFLTHGHSDHALLAPAFVTGDDPPDVFCPAEMVRLFDDFVLAKRLLNQGGVGSVDGVDADDLEDDGEETDGGADKATDNQESSEPVKNGGLRISHITHGLRHDDVVPLRRTKNITATAFKCDHTIPCLGYVFSTTTLKLRPEYASLPGPELKTLRQSGVDITAAITTPIFAFLGDTTAATLAAGPEWLRQGIPVVITECSFLREEHRAQATKTKHTFWPELEQVVRHWPRTTFILTHFSMRYSDDEVRRFFKELSDPPGNIVVWVDGEGGGLNWNNRP